MARIRRHPGGLSVLIVLLVVGGQSFGASLIDYRPTGSTIDFSSYGDGSMIPNPVSLSYSGGTATFSIPSGDFERRTQSDSWWGCFATGDALLWTGQDDPGPLTIEFSSGITAFATQIQSSYWGTGTASIWAYDASDTLLGTFTIPSTAAASGDDSATLIGVAVDAGDSLITTIELNIAGFDGVDFAISRISLATPAVPAPGAMLLVGLGSVVIGGLRRRKTL